MFWNKERKDKFIPVRPKNYRSIALHAIEIAESPRVYLDNKEITDYSEQGNLTQKGIRGLINFSISDGKKLIVGFHDHPDEMYISETYENFANYCQQQGWLKIEAPAS